MGEDLNGTVDHVLTVSSNIVHSDLNDKHTEYDVFRSNNLKDVTRVLIDVKN